METIIFLIALVAVIYILIWSIHNDDTGDDKPTQGFFRMTDENPDQKSPDKK